MASASTSPGTLSHQYVKIQPGNASLILAHRMNRSKTVVIIGSQSLAASRAVLALESGAQVVVLARGGVSKACEELRWRATNGEIEVIDLSSCSGIRAKSLGVSMNTLDHNLTYDEILKDLSVDEDALDFNDFLAVRDPGTVSFVCITDTLNVLSQDPSSSTQFPRTYASASNLKRICNLRNIAINVADIPSLCDFTFPSQHRFSRPTDNNTDNNSSTPLQIAVVTNGQGCRLGSRIKREIVAALPKEVGVAVENIGNLRRLAGKRDKVENRTNGVCAEENEREADMDEETSAVDPTPNTPVPQRTRHQVEEEDAESVRRRMKWVAQISEYWPISKLANLTEEDMVGLLDGRLNAPTSVGIPTLIPSQVPSHHQLLLEPLAPTPSQGRILLVGSGPGHPSLLTLAAHHALLTASLIYTDKLVPEPILKLIPPGVELKVARKFPGNAEGAQTEMMQTVVDAAKKGKVVVRLKQGDPTLYGRAGEEIIFFRSHGFEPIVVPGITSALAAPLLAGISVTQRGVAESLTICTGVGRKGKDVALPGYVRERTLVVLMGVARIAKVVGVLLGDSQAAAEGRTGEAYPGHLPIAIIERASLPDQRVIASTVENIEQALESNGEQRPPGLMVIGWAVLALWGEGDMSVLDDVVGNGASGIVSETRAVAKDKERVMRWLNGKKWRTIEGMDLRWDEMIKDQVGAFEREKNKYILNQELL